MQILLLCTCHLQGFNPRIWSHNGCKQNWGMRNVRSSHCRNQKLLLLQWKLGISANKRQYVQWTLLFLGAYVCFSFLSHIACYCFYVCFDLLLVLWFISFRLELILAITLWLLICIVSSLQYHIRVISFLKRTQNLLSYNFPSESSLTSSHSILYDMPHFQLFWDNL